MKKKKIVRNFAKSRISVFLNYCDCPLSSIITSLNVACAKKLIFFLFFRMRFQYLIGLVSGFYLPGLAPVSYCPQGEETEECQARLENFRFLSKFRKKIEP